MPVLFTCPKTNRQAPTRVHMDAKSLRLAWKKTLRVLCPHCGEQHKVSVRDSRAPRRRRSICFPRIRPAGPTRSDGARQAACCFYVVLTNSAYCAGWLAPGVCPR